MGDKYSIWLMPTGEVRERLKGIIALLSGRYSCPLFEPHMTLIGGLPDRDIVPRTAWLVSLLSPFAVSLVEAGCWDEYYRCLYVRVEETEEVLGAKEMAERVFGRQQGEYMPHVSLMYGNLPPHVPHVKEEIIRETEGKLDLSFLAGSLHLVSTTGGPEDWRLVEEFPFKGG